MKRNKKLLMYFLALNTIISSYTSAATTAPLKYDKVYNSIVKNIEKGNSNSTNYQLIENVLNKRNKELKDLYKQSDYIVKPEYLEWQVFFSGFYAERSRGDNTFENAEYHSDPGYKQQGYINAAGEYVITDQGKGKAYAQPQEPKEINLGVSIPIKGMTREALNLKITPAGEISINPGVQNIVAPNGVVTPLIGAYQFNPTEPDITPPAPTSPTSFTISVPNTGNGDDTGSYLGTTGQYTAKIAQYNLTSGVLEGTWASQNLSTYNATNLNGTADPGRPAMINGTTSSILPISNYNLIGGTGNGATALYKLGGAVKITLGTIGTPDALTMRIVSNVGNTYSGILPHLIQYDPHGARGTYTPYTTDYYGTPITGTPGTFDKYGELLNYARLEGIGDRLLMIALQEHTGSFSPTVKNHGTMIGLYDTAYTDGGSRHVAFTFTAPRNINGGRRFEFYNTSDGHIELQAKESIAFNYGGSPALTTIPHMTIYNDGDVVLYGNNSVGVKTGNMPMELPYSKIVLNTPIRINGDQSIGVELVKEMDDGFGNVTPGVYDPTSAAIKVTIGDEINKYAGNSATFDPNFVENSIGLYINKNTLDYRLKDFDFKFGNFASKSTLINLSSGKLFLDNVVVNDMNITAGQNNFGIIVTGASSELTLRPNMKVGTTALAVDGTVALYGSNGAKIHLDSANNIETNGTASHSVILTDTNTNLNDTTSGSNHSFITTGNSSAALYVRDGATADLSNSSIINIKSTGDKSIGVYNDGGTIKLGTAGTGSGDYEIGTNGVLFFNDKKGTVIGTIETSGVNFTVGDGSLFTKIKDPSTTLGNEQIKFTHTGSNTSLNLLNGGIGFIFTGDGVTPVTSTSIETYFSNNYSGLDNMNVTVNPGARLYVIEKYSSINLTDIGAISAPSGIFNNVTNLGGKAAFLLRGKLVLNPTSGIIDLDDPNELYNNVERALTGVTVNLGVSINGSLDNQIAILDDNSYEPTTAFYVNMINDGTINLIGKSSTGIYTNYGTITNNGLLSVTGQSGIGIFGENGTVISNTNTVTIGDKGVGIYGISHQNPSGTSLGKGDGKITITNSGTIQATTGTEAIGIYANNNKTGGTIGDSDINLSSGTIDVSNSVGGIGLFVNKGTVTDAGSTITVGQNGIGLYAKDSKIDLLNATINLNGDNALGIYLDGATSFNGTGTINISGQNITLFNMDTTATVTNNFIVGNVSAGSSYTLGNIKNGVFTYTGITSLGSNGTLVSGKDSAVFLDGATITANSGATGVAAIALDGQYTPTPPTMTPNTDGENNGSITLGDSSVGIYGKNNSRLSNLGAITMGNNSAGLMSSGTGASTINSGTINVGTGSQGIFLKDGTDIKNLFGASILSAGSGTVGLYADNVSAPIENAGTIQLLGDKSIGIYAKGISPKTINNTGTIEIGESSSTNDPNIGIFSENAGDIITISSTGTINSGINSIGVYSEGGTVIQNGISNIGDTGVGIYSTNGTVNIGGSSTFTFGTNGAVGVYAINSNVTNGAAMNIGNSNYGFVLTDGTFNNTAANVTLDNDSVFVYRSGLGAITNGVGTTVTMNGSDNIGYYIVNGGSITNDGDIIGTAGTSNVGIYNTNGSITNNGNVNIGASALAFVLDENGVPTTEVDVTNSKYAVGLYGENSTVINSGTGTINIGAGGIGLTTKGGTGTNDGDIIGNGNNTRGMYTEKGTITNTGNIFITGNDVIGMAGNGAGSNVINTGNITVTGDRAIGIYGNIGTTITNSGIITANGTGALGIVLSQGTTLNNAVNGTMIINGITSGNYESAVGTVYPTPSIINSGVIKVSEKFETDGINVIIKVDPSTVQAPTTSEITSTGYDPIAAGADYLISNSVHIEAPAFNITSPLQISGNFAEGTNVGKYKLEDVIISGSGFGINSGIVPVVSKSLTWRATPVVNSAGNIDIWMEKIPYDDFTSGLWYADFGRALDNKYLNAKGDAMAIYDKIDIVENEGDFRHLMASLAGNVYANINQREEDIARTFENSMDFIENSKNNTKENVKVNIIAGKGKNKEDTDGVVGYDFSTAGVLGLREVERTYRHTFGYSLGYLHTGFEFNDGNDSEEWVDTIQLGIHSKYSLNNWKLRNDLTGRISLHNIDRNIDWTSPNGRSEMNGTYETYSITSDNILGREIALGKNVSFMPYGAFRAMYVTRPTFSESGLEALQVEGNDAWSVKPRAGVELKAAMPLGARTAWQLKGTLDLAYEYELADLNEREKARLIAVEDGYHDLSKPEDEKGTFRTRASLGVEIEDRYGIFITGEYGVGNSDQDDYRAGVTIKAVF